jgi:hypothetical protein
MSNTTITTDSEAITVTAAYADQLFVRQIDGTHWARDDADRLYVYNDDRTVLEVAGDRVVEVCREASIETVAIIDTDSKADAGGDTAPDTTTDANGTASTDTPITTTTTD